MARQERTLHIRQGITVTRGKHLRLRRIYAQKTIEGLSLARRKR